MQITAAEKVERDRQIVAAKARSLSDATVADTFKVSERTVRDVMTAFRKGQPTLKSVDPIEVVEQVLFELRGSIEELAMVAATTKNDNVRVGAIKARIEALNQTTALMQATGVLPHDLGTLKVDMDVRAFAATVLKVFADEGIPDEVVDKVIDLLPMST